MPISQKRFQKTIWQYYYASGRDFPWRHTINPYRTVVAEIMLQQTQANRVMVFYSKFIREFPSFAALAKAPLKEVLRLWQGLGYNRRALYLKKLAEIVVKEYGGKLPVDPDQLIKLPGLGKNTVGSVLAFAFNKSYPFIETNIRRVYLYFFFAQKKSVTDVDILTLVEKTLAQKNPREWYYALMDYGAYLKTQVENPNRRSRHYLKQSKFEGSNRQIRGAIIRRLLAGPASALAISRGLPKELALVVEILSKMKAEGLVRSKGGQWQLA